MYLKKKFDSDVGPTCMYSFVESLSYNFGINAIIWNVCLFILDDLPVMFKNDLLFFLHSIG